MFYATAALFVSAVLRATAVAQYVQNEDSAAEGAATSVEGPITKHFQDWLASNGYGDDDFVRADYGTRGSFGGRISDDEQPDDRVPVLFVHGNSDSALQTNNFSTGWSSSIGYFLSHGYTSAHLYVTSWQDNVPTNAWQRSHSCSLLQRHRRFLEAVMAYTNSSKISIVSHSMGVTIARKVVHGGSMYAQDGNCFLGPALVSRVAVFYAISGCNYGLCGCAGVSMYPACSQQNGLWPGDKCGDITGASGCGLSADADPSSTSVCPLPLSYASFLQEINNDGLKDGQFVASLWSSTDELIGGKNYVWGRTTSLVPNSDDVMVLRNYSHMDTKDLTVRMQFIAVNQPLD